MLLSEAIETYLVVTQAEGSRSKALNRTGAMLSSFSIFTGDLPLRELDNLHIMLYLSTEWVNAKHKGFRYSLRDFLSQYLQLFRFFRWLEIEGLARLDFYRKWQKKLHPEDRPEKPDLPEQENPPDEGGFLFTREGSISLSWFASTPTSTPPPGPSPSVTMI